MTKYSWCKYMLEFKGGLVCFVFELVGGLSQHPIDIKYSLVLKKGENI